MKLIAAKVLIFIILSLFSMSFNAHPVYVSVTTIEHNKKEQILEVSLKVFTDDFEKALRQNYKTHIDLIDPVFKTQMKAVVRQYFPIHLKLTLNEKPCTLSFVGYEINDEALEAYYQVENVSEIKKLEVENNILFEYHQEQMNIVHVVENNQRKSYKLQNPDEKTTFIFP